MHLLGSICAFYSPVSANILFMLLHPRCCQFLIHHSWHLPWAYMGKKPNQWYLCMKYETFHNLNVRRGSGRVLMTCAHVHANVTCTMLCMNVMWWLKVEAFQSISLLPVTLGPISASDPNKVTLMWNDRGFHRSPPTVSFFVILSFSYTHTPYIAATLTRQPNTLILLFCLQKMSWFIHFCSHKASQFLQ